MKRELLGVVLAAAVGVACGSTQQAATDEEKKALEQRVAELERQLAAASPAPAPEDEAAPAATSGDGDVEEAPQASASEPYKRSRPARAAAAPSRTAAKPAPAREPVEPATPVRSEPVRPDVAEPAATADADVPPAREPARREPEPIWIPKGTSLHLVLERGLSSVSSQVGDTVTARIERAVGEDGDVVLPGGAFLEGRVTEVVSSGRVKGRARVAAAFERIVVRGERYRIETTGFVAEADDSHARDAKIAGGSTAVGAILGAITGGKKGAAKGVLIGGAAGAGAVLLTKGEEIEIPAGGRWQVTVTASRRFRPLP
jgi:type IV secretory pathway VirB10-like protein